MYSFHKFITIDETPTSVQVVYPNQEDSEDHLASNLEQIVETYNRRLPPSRLLFVCPKGVEKRVKRVFDNKWSEFEGRLASTTHVSITSYDKHGVLVPNLIFHQKSCGIDWVINDNFLEDLGKLAVGKIFDETKTILHAPHGYVFRKLSGREENIFLRAGNMLRMPGCLMVFNHLLLRRLPFGCKVIYIDSFTILSFALGLQSLISYFRRTEPTVPALAIENIHSYEIAPDFRIPNDTNYLILISASTSGGLARKLVDEKQADLTRIVHLLGVGPTEKTFKNSCVYFRPSTVKSATHQHNAPIEISTEEFLVSQGSPRPVHITRDHVNRDGARELHKTFYKEALKFCEPGPTTQGSYSMFSVSSTYKADYADEEPPPIYKWVCGALVHEIPASVCVLAHLGDPMSTSVAAWLCKALRDRFPTISLDDLNSESDDTYTHGSIVVVAHFDPNLEGLREANIEFRRMRNVHRHYVLGYAFPSSLAEHRRLKNDLCMGGSGPQYGWSEYLVLPVGADRVHESLSPHSYSIGFDATGLGPDELDCNLIGALKERATRTSIPHDSLFLPRTDGTPLVLRHGSVFFSGTQTDNVSQTAVYAMVSAAMQAAREPVPDNRKSATRPGFDDNPFVRTVLDPSMFARFNDGILQASLLRSAQRSELDYSASKDLSHQFASICRSVFVSHNDAVGDAALEFIHALATKKVSLREEDINWLCEKIQSIPELKVVYDCFRAQ